MCTTIVAGKAIAAALGLADAVLGLPRTATRGRVEPWAPACHGRDNSTCSCIVVSRLRQSANAVANSPPRLASSPCYAHSTVDAALSGRPDTLPSIVHQCSTAPRVSCPIYTFAASSGYSSYSLMLSACILRVIASPSALFYLCGTLVVSSVSWDLTHLSLHCKLSCAPFLRSTRHSAYFSGAHPSNVQNCTSQPASTHLHTASKPVLSTTQNTHHNSALGTRSPPAVRPFTAPWRRWGWWAQTLRTPPPPRAPWLPPAAPAAPPH